MSSSDLSRLAVAVSRPSVRLRVAAWTVVVSLAVQLALGLVILLYQRSALDRFFATRLEQGAAGMARELEAMGRAPTDGDLQALAARAMALPVAEGVYAAIYRGDGGVLAATARPPIGTEGLASLGTEDGRSRRLALPGLRMAGDGNEFGRAISRPLALTGVEGARLTVATTDSTFEGLAGLAARVVALCVACGTAATGLAAWLVSGICVRPLRRLREIAESFSPESIREPQPAAADRNAFERDLAEVRERLRQAITAQDRLISHVSHELRTPVAVLLTEAQTIEPASLSPEAGRFVRSVRQEMQRLSRTIDAFLTLTRIRSGAQDIPDDSLCDLNEVALSAVGSCTGAAGEHGVTLRAELSDTGEAPMVVGDPELLRALVERLVRGAIRASASGDEISVAVESGDRVRRIVVHDAGSGPSAEEASRLFDGFTGSAAPGSRASINLAVAQGIAEAHNGRVTARGAPAGGCDFVLELPAERGRGGGADGAP